MIRYSLSVLFCLFALFVHAQTVKPYLATIKTLKGKQKGILYKIDSAYVTLNDEDKFELISFADIKSIKLKVVKKSDADFIKFTKYDPWNKDNFEKNASGAIVRKWGEKDPSLGEEIGGHIAATAINVAGNLIAAPIQSINPSVAAFKINNDRRLYYTALNDLEYYTVYYQSNPNVTAELKKIKQISESAKVQFKP